MKRYNAKLDRKIWLHFTARHTAIWRPSLKLSLLLIRAVKERLFKSRLVPVIAPLFPLLLEVKSVSRGHTALKIVSINDIVLLQMTTNTASFLKASILLADTVFPPPPDERALYKYNVAIRNGELSEVIAYTKNAAQDRCSTVIFR